MNRIYLATSMQIDSAGPHGMLQPNLRPPALWDGYVSLLFPS